MDPNIIKLANMSIDKYNQIMSNTNRSSGMIETNGTTGTTENTGTSRSNSSSNSKSNLSDRNKDLESSLETFNKDEIIQIISTSIFSTNKNPDIKIKEKEKNTDEQMEEIFTKYSNVKIKLNKLWNKVY